MKNCSKLQYFILKLIPSSTFKCHELAVFQGEKVILRQLIFKATFHYTWGIQVLLFILID